MEPRGDPPIHRLECGTSFHHMRRISPTVGVALCMGSALCASFPGQALAVEWTSPTAIPGSREAVLSRVAISRYDVIAVAGEPGFVAVRLREGRWLPGARSPPRTGS